MRYFVHKLPLAYNEKPEKGDNSVMDFENFAKSQASVYRTIGPTLDLKYL